MKQWQQQQQQQQQGDAGSNGGSGSSAAAMAAAVVSRFAFRKQLLQGIIKLKHRQKQVSRSVMYTCDAHVHT
jgi:hypothetical protein